MRGFTFRETMSGSYRLRSNHDGERPISIALRASSRSLRDFFRSAEVEIGGEVDAEAFADHARLEGTLRLDVFRTGKLRYRFRFVANDDRPYRFEGEKTLDRKNIVHSMTVLPGRILDENGDEVATVHLRFDLRGELVPFLRSWAAVF